MKLYPAKNIVICVTPPPEKTKSGLDLVRDKKGGQIGIVYAVGEPIEEKDKLPFQLKVGDKVVFRKYGENLAEIQGVEYNFVTFPDIVAFQEVEEDQSN